VCPQRRIVGRHARAEDLVQIAEAGGLVQVGVGKPVDAQRHRIERLVHLGVEIRRLENLSILHGGGLALSERGHCRVSRRV
jgi:hypothetical protein